MSKFEIDLNSNNTVKIQALDFIIDKLNDLDPDEKDSLEDIRDILTAEQRANGAWNLYTEDNKKLVLTIVAELMAGDEFVENIFEIVDDLGGLTVNNLADANRISMIFMSEAVESLFLYGIEAYEGAMGVEGYEARFTDASRDFLIKYFEHELAKTTNEGK